MKVENDKAVLDVTNADVSHSTFKNVRAEQLSFQCCNLSGMNMHDVNLTGFRIADANLSELHINGAQWGGAHFECIGFGNPIQPDVEFITTPVQFSNCNFDQGVFQDCNLSNVRMDNCNISGLVINGVDIEKLMKQYGSTEPK